MKAQVGPSSISRTAAAAGRGRRVSAPSAPASLPAQRSAVAQFSPLRDFLGVYADPRTWSALAFTLLSLVTGILYFTWAITGLSLSLGFLLLIIGLPFAYLFLLSVRGLGRVEAALVQALLDVRLRPRPMFPESGLSLLRRAKALVSSQQTWLSFLYLVLQLPLGVIYFSVGVCLLALALGIMAAPLAQILGDVKVITIGQTRLWLPFWGVALMEMVGFLLLTATMHGIRGIGRWHAKYAHALLGT